MPSAAIRADRIARGMCATCGAAPSADGRVNCEGCLAAQREVVARRREAQRKQGLCTTCGTRQQADGRGGRCDECADREAPAHAERMRARRAG